MNCCRKPSSAVAPGDASPGAESDSGSNGLQGVIPGTDRRSARNGPRGSSASLSSSSQQSRGSSQSEHVPARRYGGQLDMPPVDVGVPRSTSQSLSARTAGSASPRTPRNRYVGAPQLRGTLSHDYLDGDIAGVGGVAHAHLLVEEKHDKEIPFQGKGQSHLWDDSLDGSSLSISVVASDGRRRSVAEREAQRAGLPIMERKRLPVSAREPREVAHRASARTRHTHAGLQASTVTAYGSTRGHRTTAGSVRRGQSKRRRGDRPVEGTSYRRRTRERRQRHGGGGENPHTSASIPPMRGGFKLAASPYDLAPATSVVLPATRRAAGPRGDVVRGGGKAAATIASNSSLLDLSRTPMGSTVAGYRQRVGGKSGLPDWSESLSSEVDT